jgi:hypothetical protein
MIYSDKMKINIEVLFVIILIILNLSVGGFFLYIINVIESPSISAEINLTDITSNEIVIDAKIDISNPNPFDLIIGDIQLVSETSEGNKFTNISIDGGKVLSNNNKTFSHTKDVSFSGNIPKILKNSITADVGVRVFGFIEKSIPVEAIVIVSAKELIDNLSIPDINIHAGIEEITGEGIIFKSVVEIKNPSNIQLKVDNVFVDLTTEENKSVGSLDLKGGTLTPKGSLTLEALGTVLFEAINAKNIIIDLEGSATGKVAGLTQSITLSASTIIDIPNLSELLSLDNDSLEATVEGEFKIRIRGLITTIGLKIYNPTNIPLEGNDFICGIYGATGEKKKLLAEEKMEPCSDGSLYDICMESQLIIKYFKLLTSGSGRIVPEWLNIHIKGNLSIEGTNQKIPVKVNGNLDPRIFR